MVKLSRLQISRYVSEFIGTATLVCAIKMIVAHSNAIEFSVPTPESMAKAILFSGVFQGIALTSIVYLFGYNSFGMFNPAVTIGHVIRNEDQFQRKYGYNWTMYILVQLVGSVAGGFLSIIAGGKKAGREYMFIDYPNHFLTEAFLSELFFTFILVSVHIHSVADKRIAGNQFYGIAIGSVLAVASVAIRPISGCAINPAVWFGALMSAWYVLDDDGEDLENTKYSWIYPVAHISAGIVAGCWYKIVYAPYGDDEADGWNDEESSESEEEDYDQDEDDVSRASHLLA